MTNYMTKLKTSIAIGALMVGTMMGAAAAEANVTYKYTAPNFNVAVLPFTTSMHIEIDFTMATALAGSTLYSDIPTAAGFVSYSASVMNGITPFFTLNNTDSAAPSFKITTNIAGIPLAYTIAILDPDGCSIASSPFCSISSISGGLSGTAFISNEIFAGSTSGLDGIWTIVHETPSPEVTGLMLGGLGLMGFAALRRK